MDNFYTTVWITFLRPACGGTGGGTCSGTCTGRTWAHGDTGPRARKLHTGTRPRRAYA